MYAVKVSNRNASDPATPRRAPLADRGLRVRGAQVRPEHAMVGLRHAEQIRDHEHANGCAKSCSTSNPTVSASMPVVTLSVPVVPRWRCTSSICASARRSAERLALLQALRGQQSHEETTLGGVHRRVVGDEVLPHRHGVAMALDEHADVIADRRLRQSGERAGHGVARGERGWVTPHLGRLVVARDRHHAVMGKGRDRAGPPQVIEVRVRVLDERRVGEEVDGVEVVHPAPGPVLCSRPACCASA